MVHVISIVAHSTLVPFSSLFQCVVCLPHSLPSEKYLRQLKQEKYVTLVTNMFIKVRLFFSFCLLPSVIWNESPWLQTLCICLVPELFIQTDVLISSSPVPAEAFFFLFLCLAQWKVCVSFELL